jgi:hypothetical protein
MEVVSVGTGIASEENGQAVEGDVAPMRELGKSILAPTNPAPSSGSPE